MATQERIDDIISCSATVANQIKYFLCISKYIFSYKRETADTYFF